MLVGRDKDLDRAAAKLGDSIKALDTPNIVPIFIGITLDMMKYADDNNLSPAVTCREYEMCKVTWPQPGDSWAAQTFIRHEGVWRWLDY